MFPDRLPGQLCFLTRPTHSSLRRRFRSPGQQVQAHRSTSQWLHPLHGTFGRQSLASTQFRKGQEDRRVIGCRSVMRNRSTIAKSIVRIRPAALRPRNRHEPISSSVLIYGNSGRVGLADQIAIGVIRVTCPTCSRVLVERIGRVVRNIPICRRRDSVAGCVVPGTAVLLGQRRRARHRHVRDRLARVEVGADQLAGRIVAIRPLAVRRRDLDRARGLVVCVIGTRPSGSRRHPGP